jgi:serine protease Do
MSVAFHDAAEQVLPAVVSITNRPTVALHNKPEAKDNSEDSPFGMQGSPFGDLFKNNPGFRQFFKHFPSNPEMQSPEEAGAGSGVIVDPSGVILTNNHVVAGGGEITVRLHDGREFMGVDIKTDPMSDLAIVRIKGAGSLPYARLGDSNKVDVGDWVLALGQPFGLEGTVTAGIISAKGRGLAITDQGDFLQTDAAINPGNSGGPLVTLDGEVIGINTAISTNNGGYQGVGFAIPIDRAKWVGGQLINGGKVHRAYLGVAIQTLTSPLAQQFKVNVHQGVLVTEVRSGTPAEKAGLKPGDIVLKFAGQSVTTPRELQSAVEMQKIGSSEPIELLRDGKEMTVNVTTREMPINYMAARTESQEQGKETSHFDKLGLQVEDLTPQVAEQLGIKTDHGVAITEVRSGGAAEIAGLTTGMVITEVNRQAVNNVGDFRKALDASPLNKGVLLLVRTAEGSRFVVIRVES